MGFSLKRKIRPPIFQPSLSSVVVVVLVVLVVSECSTTVILIAILVKTIMSYNFIESMQFLALDQLQIEPLIEYQIHNTRTTTSTTTL